MSTRKINIRFQQGMTIITLVFIIGLAATAFLLNALNANTVKIERDKKTAAALAEAKAALIGYAASVDLTSSGPRPGDLPCPDNHVPGSLMEGTPSSPCGGNALGRLPWKKLGIQDLRDGSGERLWYAVSVNFKNSPRTGLLNSDSFGTISVRDRYGNIRNNGCLTYALPDCPNPGASDAGFGTGAIAVIIAPGAALNRQDGVQQVRDGVNANNPVNYLDNVTGEDNANFVNGKLDGFINGDVLDAQGSVILNDHVLMIAPSDLMPMLEKRVSGEVLLCLNEYAVKPQNKGRYPWAAPLNPLSLSYSDVSGSRFGRVPNTPFTQTKTDSGSVNPMDDSWTGSCNINIGSWWANWKEMVFYALADAYKPVNLDISVSSPVCGLTGTCLTVNPPDAVADKAVAVLLSGRQLAGIPGGQPRIATLAKGTIANYLESQNSTPLDDMFTKNISSGTFNDYVRYKK